MWQVIWVGWVGGFTFLLALVDTISYAFKLSVAIWKSSLG